MGGVARNTREVMVTCEAAGYEVVLIETVGVGQSETVVADMVDFFLVVLITGAGGDLRGIKRGLMEMADPVAINKAEGDNKVHAERACALYQNAMRLVHPADSPWNPPVVTCSAVRNTGVDAIWSQALKHRARFEPTGWFEQHRRAQRCRWMWDIVNEYIDRLLHGRPEIRAISTQVESAVRSGSMTAADGAETVLRAIGIGEAAPS